MIRCRAAVVCLLLLAATQRAEPCSYCNGNFQQRLTLRQNAKLAAFVVLGTLQNARLDGDKGSTEFVIDEVIQSAPALGNQRQLTIPSYVPTDPKNPQRYLLFGELTSGRLQIVYSCPATSKATAAYLAATLKIDDRDRSAILQFAARFLDAAEPDVAADAFHELAKATDQEIAQVAPKLAPEKFRAALNDPKTPAERVGIYAYLLGACGHAKDAPLLAALAEKKEARGNPALSGLLGGLIELRPDTGWPLLQQILSDPNRPLADKLQAQGTLRFYHSSKPTHSRKEILACMLALVEQGDLADLAIEDLRRWQWWDLTPNILAQYGKPTHRAPIVRNAIIRYAIGCPRSEAAEFVRARQSAEPMLVSRVKESLEYEKPAAPANNP